MTLLTGTKRGRLNLIYFLVALSTNAVAEEYSQAVLDQVEQARASSAREEFLPPQIDSVSAGGKVVWNKTTPIPATLQVGDIVTLVGSGFGEGPDIDYGKIKIGNIRVLERDLVMYQGAVSLVQRLFYEVPQTFDSWPKDILAWSENRIQFRVPKTATRGPIVVQNQKRQSSVDSIQNPGQPFLTMDAVTERVRNLPQGFDVISRLSSTQASNPVPVTIVNPSVSLQQKLGEAIFWVYDFNMGMVHKLDGLNWNNILSRQTSDPVKGGTADPTVLFGAIPLNRGEVPDVALKAFDFDPYPMPSPIKPILRAALSSGKATPSGFVGYTSNEAIHPILQTKGSWVGMSCAACHTQRITYEAFPGVMVSKVFPGLPNPNWSMKWTTLGGGLKTITGQETGADGNTEFVDKTLLLYSVPPGTGEHTLVRAPNDGSIYGNDQFFSPSAFPIITRHTPLRRSLSHGEMYAGFEGSYIHSEEPDGAVGAMSTAALQAFTVYMSTLDENDTALQNLGLYRWLKRSGNLADVSSDSEGAFMAQGRQHYDSLQNKIFHGQSLYGTYCIRCHESNGGTWSNEDMLPFTEVGTYFSPTLFQRRAQAIRTAMIRNLFWVEPRGLLHDGHVKSVEDLIDPDRCREGSALYDHYYTLNAATFKIPKGTPAQELALRRQAYFSDVTWDSENLYWDYQKMRKNFGVLEFGSASPVVLPAAPHPWCVGDRSEMGDLVRYLLTL
jgi:hypothetical protein